MFELVKEPAIAPIRPRRRPGTVECTPAPVSVADRVTTAAVFAVASAPRSGAFSGRWILVSLSLRRATTSGSKPICRRCPTPSCIGGAPIANARHPLFPLLATSSAYALRTVGLSDRSILAALSAFVGAMGWPVLCDRPCWLQGGGSTRLSSRPWPARHRAPCSGSAFRKPTPSARDVARSGGALRVEPSGASGEAWYVAASAVSLSVTTTNWMSGICAAAARWPWRRALQITANALCVVIVLWAVQRTILPSAPFFFGYSNEARFMLPPRSGGPGPVARVLFFHSIVMPHIDMIPEPKWGAVMSVQHSAIGSAGAWGVAASVPGGAPGGGDRWPGGVGRRTCGSMPASDHGRSTAASPDVRRRDVPVRDAHRAVARADDDGGGSSRRGAARSRPRRCAGLAAAVNNTSELPNGAGILCSSVVGPRAPMSSAQLE